MESTQQGKDIEEEEEAKPQGLTLFKAIDWGLILILIVLIGWLLIQKSYCNTIIKVTPEQLKTNLSFILNYTGG